MPDTRIGWEGLSQGRDIPPTFAEQAQSQRELEASQSYGELQKLSVENQWISYGASRAIDRQVDFEPDATFSVPKEQEDTLRREFGFEAAQEMKGAKSSKELESMMSWRRSDIERNKKLSGYGINGIAAQVTAGLLDPVGWGSAILTGGVGGGAKLTQLGRALRMATATGIEATAFETVMYAGDTQRTVDDILLSAATGGIMGGTVGMLTRANPAKANIVKTYDKFDRELSRNVLASMENDARKAMAEFNVPTHQVDIPSHVEALRQKARVTATGKQKGMMKKEIRKLNSNIASLKIKKQEAIAGMAAKRGAPKNADEAKAIADAKTTINDEFNPQIEALETQLDITSTRLSSVEGVTEAKRNLRDFLAMSPEQQRAHLSPVPKQTVDNSAARKAAVSEVIEEAKVKAEYAQPTPKEGGSVGAAKVDPDKTSEDPFAMSEDLEDLMYDLELEAEASGVKVISGKNKAAKALQSTFATLASSENPTVKGLALRLLENPQGNSYAEKTASILSHYYGRIMRTAGKNRYNDGFDEYLKEIGVGKVKGYLNKEHQKDFNRQVYNAILDPSNATDAVKKAADGARDQLQVALKLRKEAGEAGFENVTEAADYIPLIFDGANMTRAINKVGYGRVRKAIATGYETGKIKLKPNTAKKVAEMQMIRTMDATLSSRVTFEKVVSATERQRFIDELTEAGVPTDVIEDFVADKAIREMMDSSSSRSKFALGINVRAEFDGVSVKDIVNTNVPELVENYIKEAAGGAAMARKGFKTKQEALNAIDASERYGRNMDVDGKFLKEANVRDEADQLRQSVDLIYGHTIDENPNASHVIAARRAREYTSLVRLGMLGFAQAPEMARAISHLSLSTVLESVPSFAVFTKRARLGKNAAGALEEPELREMEELLGYVGEDEWLTGWSVRHDEFGENPDVASKVGEYADRAMAAGSRMNTSLSGFKAVQGTLDKITTRGVSKRIKEQLEGGRSMPTAALEEAGFDQKFMDDLKEFYDANPKFDDFNGRKVRVLNIEKMDAAMREQLGVGITRMSGRIIQKNFVGETSTWMNTWIGKSFTQFKTFSVVSAEKQLIHDVRGDKIKAAQTLALSTMAAGLTYSVQSKLKSLGRDDDEQYLADKLSSENMAWGIWGKLPQTASLSLVGDVLASFGALPESATSSYGTGGFQQYNSVGDVIPSVGALQDSLGLVKGMVNYVQGDDSLSDRQLMDKLRRATPLMNTIGVGQLTKAAVDTLEN